MHVAPIVNMNTFANANYEDDSIPFWDADKQAVELISHVCMDGERDVQAVLPHPDSEKNGIHVHFQVRKGLEIC